MNCQMADTVTEFDVRSPRPPVIGEESDSSVKDFAKLEEAESKANHSFVYTGLGSHAKSHPGSLSPATPRRNYRLRGGASSDGEVPLEYEPLRSPDCQSICSEDSLSTPPYLRWAESLYHLLEDAEGVILFSEYLKQVEDSVHLLDFWYGCKALRETLPSNRDFLIAFAQKMYDKYICVRSEECIRKIKPETRRSLADALRDPTKSSVGPSFFDESQREVEVLLTTLHLAFIQSDFYLEYVQCAQEEAQETGLASGDSPKYYFPADHDRDGYGGGDYMSAQPPASSLSYFLAPVIEEGEESLVQEGAAGGCLTSMIDGLQADDYDPKRSYSSASTIFLPTSDDVTVGAAGRSDCSVDMSASAPSFPAFKDSSKTSNERSNPSGASAIVPGNSKDLKSSDSSVGASSSSVPALPPPRNQTPRYPPNLPTKPPSLNQSQQITQQQPVKQSTGTLAKPSAQAPVSASKSHQTKSREVNSGNVGFPPPVNYSQSSTINQRFHRMHPEQSAFPLHPYHTHYVPQLPTSAQDSDFQSSEADTNVSNNYSDLSVSDTFPICPSAKQLRKQKEFIKRNVEVNRDSGSAPNIPRTKPVAALSCPDQLAQRNPAEFATVIINKLEAIKRDLDEKERLNVSLQQILVAEKGLDSADSKREAILQYKGKQSRQPEEHHAILDEHCSRTWQDTPKHSPLRSPGQFWSSAVAGRIGGRRRSPGKRSPTGSRSPDRHRYPMSRLGTVHPSYALPFATSPLAFPGQYPPSSLFPTAHAPTYPGNSVSGDSLSMQTAAPNSFANHAGYNPAGYPGGARMPTSGSGMGYHSGARPRSSAGPNNAVLPSTFVGNAGHGGCVNPYSSYPGGGSSINGHGATGQPRLPTTSGVPGIPQSLTSTEAQLQKNPLAGGIGSGPSGSISRGSRGTSTNPTAMNSGATPGQHPLQSGPPMPQLVQAGSTTTSTSSNSNSSGVGSSVSFAAGPGGAGLSSPAAGLPGDAVGGSSSRRVTLGAGGPPPSTKPKCLPRRSMNPLSDTSGVDTSSGDSSGRSMASTCISGTDKSPAAWHAQQEPDHKRAASIGTSMTGSKSSQGKDKSRSQKSTASDHGGTLTRPVRQSGNVGNGGKLVQPEVPPATLPSSMITSTTSTTSSSSSTHQSIVYYMNDEKVPYVPTFSGRIEDLTLKRFKQILSRKGKFKYYFMCAIDPELPAAWHEITCDTDLLPVYFGKVQGKVVSQESANESDSTEP